MLEGLHDLGNWMLSWAGTPYGVAALAGVAFAEASFLPILPDILLIALCLLDPAGAFLYAGICSLASALGGIFGYELGRWGGRPLVKWVISERKLRFIERYYQKYDVWPVAIAGFVPLPYKFFTISAGVFLLDLKRFILASVLARSGRFFLLGVFLYFFGEPAAAFIQDYAEVMAMTVAGLLILATIFLYCHARRQSTDALKSS